MRFQERDGRLLQFIYDNDGVVAVSQLQRRFWPGKSLRAVQKRMQKLCAAGYLARPTREDYRTQPVPEPVVWLDWRGVLTIAQHAGHPIDVSSPPTNAHRRRRLAAQLRKSGIRWVWRPRWGKLVHDLQVIDVRLAVETAVGASPWLSLKRWLPESGFRAEMDVVSFTVAGRNGRPKQARGVIPDSAFVLADARRRAAGRPYRLRYLLELDRATHSNPSFGRDKVRPYAAYLSSPAYRARLGANAGRWLVVTSGQRRLKNLMRQTEASAGPDAGLFYFATIEQMQRDDVLADPIWRRVGAAAPAALVPRRTSGRLSAGVARGPAQAGSVAIHQP